jgi:hypothetical protein
VIISTMSNANAATQRPIGNTMSIGVNGVLADASASFGLESSVDGSYGVFANRCRPRPTGATSGGPAASASQYGRPERAPAEPPRAPARSSRAPRRQRWPPRKRSSPASSAPRPRARGARSSARSPGTGDQPGRPPHPPAAASHRQLHAAGGASVKASASAAVHTQRDPDFAVFIWLSMSRPCAGAPAGWGASAMPTPPLLLEFGDVVLVILHLSLM